MSNRTLNLTDRLYDYIQAVSVREPDILRRLREKTARLGTVSGMQIAPEQGQFMAFLVEMLGARRLLEVGTFTGYSALVCALALPPEGRLTACDVNPEWTKMARQFWEEAGVADKIELKLAPALETLQSLLDQGQAGSYDMAFIDADKKNYDSYYEAVFKLVRQGGVILIDNVLWDGRVADPDEQDENTIAIRDLNAKLFKDERISLSLLPLADGLTLARKR